MKLNSVWFIDEEFYHLIWNLRFLEDLLLSFYCLPERIKTSSNELMNLQFYTCENFKLIDADILSLPVQSNYIII